MNMPTGVFSPARVLEVVCMAAALALMVACGGKKSPAEEDEPAARAAAPAVKEAVTPSNATPAETAPKQAGTQDDPLLGTWKVVKAEGFYGEQNTGVIWSFDRNGTAISITRFSTEFKGRGEILEQTPAAEEKKVTWSWKRFDPDSIEISHPKSGSIASIRHRMDGTQLVLDWNNGSQILYLEKQK